MRLRLPRSERQRLLWLVAFGALTRNEIAKLSEFQLARLRSQVWSFPYRTMTLGSDDTLAPKKIAELASKVGAGIRALMRGDPWRPKIGSITLYVALRNEQAQLRYIADHWDGFLLEAGELIASEGKRLRKCAHGVCQKVFVANKRQTFCGERCAQIERAERFRRRHGSKALSERRHERYVKKVRRTKGDAVARKVRWRILTS